MDNEKQQFLQTLHIDSIILIRDEAEKYIQHQIESESIIIGKATGMFQLFIAIIISIVGYFVSLKSLSENVIIFVCGLVVILFVGKSIFLLSKCINPSLTHTTGASPSVLLDDMIFFGANNDEKKRTFMIQRVYNLDKAITENRQVQTKRVDNYKRAIKNVMLGLVVLITVFFLLSTLQYFLCEFEVLMYLS